MAKKALAKRGTTKATVPTVIEPVKLNKTDIFELCLSTVQHRLEDELDLNIKRLEQAIDLYEKTHNSLMQAARDKARDKVKNLLQHASGGEPHMEVVTDCPQSARGGKALLQDKNIPKAFRDTYREAFGYADDGSRYSYRRERRKVETGLDTLITQGLKIRPMEKIDYVIVSAGACKSAYGSNKNVKTGDVHISTAVDGSKLPLAKEIKAWQAACNQVMELVPIVHRANKQMKEFTKKSSRAKVKLLRSLLEQSDEGQAILESVAQFTIDPSSLIE